MKTIIPLNQANLSEAGKHLSVPNYNRSADTARIVHIGVGGFHRSHLAYYLHQLKKSDTDLEWGICGIGLRETDGKINDILKRQDYLYTLMVKNPNGTIKPEVIGSIVDFKMGTSDPEQVIARLAHADTKLVSLTITEGGYNFNPITGEFNFGNRDIQQELKHPKEPITVFGFLTAALKKRRDIGLPGYTILSCDNIEHNGDMMRKMLLVFAEAQDANLAAWIAQEVSFPNSMVDRITPVTTNTDRETLAKDYSLLDAWPVTCEPFIQWVVEDKFLNDRPPFEKVGVQFVPDVAPYEKMKLRLLNAGHSVLGILGALHGHPTIHACMQDKTFVRFLRNFLEKEATPILGSIDGIDLSSYINTLLERFANPNIKDSVGRICSESSAKLPKFLIATLHDNLDTGGSIKYATYLIAAWCYYSDKKINRDGDSIEIRDAMENELHQHAKQTQTDPLAFIRQNTIFGDLKYIERFTKLYIEMVQQIYKDPDVKKYMKNML